MNFPLRSLAPLALAGFVLVLGACTPSEKTDGEPSTGAAAETAGAEAGKEADGAGPVPGIEGLETEREQVSYMIGMDMAKSLAPL